MLGRKEIDIYFPKLKIGIEYQGGQHFKPVDLFGGEEQFKKQLERDYEKIEQCKQNGIILLHFTYDNKIKTNVSYNVYNNINDIFNIIETIQPAAGVFFPSSRTAAAIWNRADTAAR